MVTITLIDRAGLATDIVIESGLTLMEAVRQAGGWELEALCGGNCSCATCHVYLSASGLLEMSEDEDDLLGSSDQRQPDSRLSCQIPVTAALNGVTVTIAPDD